MDDVDEGGADINCGSCEESDEEDWRIDLETRDRSENKQIASCESEDEDNDSDDSLVHARSKKRMRQDEPVGAVEGV